MNGLPYLSIYLVYLDICIFGYIYLVFGSPLPGTVTVLVLAPCIFGIPFPGTGTLLVPTLLVPSILH